MNIKTIDSEYGVAIGRSTDIPSWVTALGKAEEVAFFYFHQRDLIVLNEDNVNYAFYAEIIPEYLSLGNIERKEFKGYTKEIRAEMYTAVRCLNYIDRIRRRLYKKLLKAKQNPKGAATPKGQN